jgi:hypothetical protein
VRILPLQALSFRFSFQAGVENLSGFIVADVLFLIFNLLQDSRLQCAFRIGAVLIVPLPVFSPLFLVPKTGFVATTARIDLLPVFTFAGDYFLFFILRAPLQCAFSNQSRFDNTVAGVFATFPCPEDWIRSCITVFQTDCRKK